MLSMLSLYLNDSYPASASFFPNIPNSSKNDAVIKR